jgi:colanic acid/amylovoran biosynthesis glycosyltransferase
LFLLIQTSIQQKRINNPKWWGDYLPVILHQPDVFHIQWAKSLEYWMPLQSVFHIPIVLSLRGAHINYSPLGDASLAASYRRYFPEIKAIHAVSAQIALEAQKYGAQISDIKVIYSGFEEQDFTAHQKINHEIAEPIRILSVGRDHWKKGYSFALLAIKNLLQQGYEIHYEMVIGQASEALLFQIHDLNLSDHITIRPQMHWEDILPKMQQSDFLLLSSVEEGIANVVLEAMMLGLPVVSSDCGGMNEILTDGNNGFLYYRWDSSQACEKIKECINASPQKRAEMALNARHFVTKNHNIYQKIEEFTALYDQALGRRS